MRRGSASSLRLFEKKKKNGILLIVTFPFSMKPFLQKQISKILTSKGFTFVELIIVISMIAIMTTGSLIVFSEDQQQTNVGLLEKKIKNILLLSRSTAIAGLAKKVIFTFQPATPHYFSENRTPATLSDALPQDLTISSITLPILTQTGSISLSWSTPILASSDTLTLTLKNDKGNMVTQTGASNSFDSYTFADIPWDNALEFSVCFTNSIQKCTNTIVIHFLDLDAIRKNKESFQLIQMDASRNGTNVTTPLVTTLQDDSNGGIRVFADGKEVSTLSLLIQKNNKNGFSLLLP